MCIKLSLYSAAQIEHAGHISYEIPEKNMDLWLIKDKIKNTAFLICTAVFYT